MTRFALALLATVLAAQPPSAPARKDPSSVEAATLYKQARALASKDPHAAISLYRRALALSTAAGERFEEALTAHNLASALWDVGANDEALALYQRALAIRTGIGDTTGLGYTHYGIALAHWTWGDAASALASFEQALSLWRRQNNIAGQADVLNATGLALMSLGETARAGDRYRQALALWEQAGHGVGQGYTRNNLGMLHFAGRHYDAAASEYARAMELLTAAGDNRGIAYVRHNQGDLAAARGDTAAAIQAYEDSLARKRSVDDKYGAALTLTRLAQAQLTAGGAESAQTTAEEALALHRAIGNRTGETATLASLSAIASARNRPAEAEKQAAAAVALSEQTRAAISNDELSTSYFATQQDLYARLIALRTDAGRHTEAFETSERSRARVLLDAVAGLRPPGASLAERRDVERLIHAAVQRRNAQAADELLHRWAAVEARLRDSGQDTTPEPAPFDTIRRQLLAPGTALLEYFAGERSGYAWLVTPHSLYTATLPPRATLDGLTRRYREALTARAAAPPGESAAARAARLARADAQLASAARALGDALLRPFADHLSVQRLLIVPDGPLHQLPFAALPLGSGLLLDRTEAVTLPSASLALQLHLKPAPSPSGPPLTLLAAPAFNASWAPLPMTAFEARSIAQLSPGARVLTGAAATRAALLKPPHLDARILHLATHARADAGRPALSRIALASGDELTLADIYGLPLHSRLVVLSGCETALGRDVAGEGPVSLSRAFFYAGARTVAASLWNVQDRATAELMRHFYRGLLLKRLPPAAALRAAQLSLRKDARWNHAYYWAPFLVLGDWR
ncbi:MAG: CHAT domain-containing protein [Bryobacterales bacterium]|nr:CHAT domain-containing protein [Bryobacterales bacterium]